MKYIKKVKLDKIKLDKTNMYVAIDFDKTITATYKIGRASCRERV